MRGARLERFKFAIYVITPVVAVYVFSQPSVHEFIFANRRYILVKEDAHADIAAEAAAFRRKRAAAAAAAAGTEPPAAQQQHR